MDEVNQATDTGVESIGAPASSRINMSPARVTKKLLVVDDNEQILRLVQRMLSAADFEVDTAIGPAQAIAWCEQFGPPDLLISDVRMPVMSGFRLYDQLVSTFGHFPVMYISGDTGGEWDGASHVLEKPFSKMELVNAINGYFPPSE